MVGKSVSTKRKWLLQQSDLLQILMHDVHKYVEVNVLTYLKSKKTLD